MYTFKGRQIFETIQEMVNPAHTVVMVHDMQNDFLAEGGSLFKAGEKVNVSRILQPMVEFVDVARQNQVNVMYTNYTDLPEFGSYDDPMTSKRWAMVSNPAEQGHANPAVIGTWGCQTIDELAPKEGEIVINKYRTNTFINSNFELVLRSNSSKTIIHTGIATEIGILPTAWQAVSIGFFPIVPRDLVGPRQPQFHDDAMKFLERLVWVVDSSEIVEAWKSY